MPQTHFLKIYIFFIFLIYTYRYEENMVLKDDIVAIEIKQFTRISSKGSSEQKIIGAKTYKNRKKTLCLLL